MANNTYADSASLFIAIDADAAGAGVNNVDCRDLNDSPEPITYPTAW